MNAYPLPVLSPALPEMLLAVGAMVLLMFGAFRGERSTGTVNGWTIVLLVVAGALVIWLPGDQLVTFGGSFVVDKFAKFMKVLSLIGSAVTIILSWNYFQREKQARFEYAVLILFSTIGMMVLVSASDLIALYLGLELMSLALYVLAASNRDSVRASEASLKYFVLGALSAEQQSKVGRKRLRRRWPPRGVPLKVQLTW